MTTLFGMMIVGRQDDVHRHNFFPQLSGGSVRNNPTSVPPHLLTLLPLATRWIIIILPGLIFQKEFFFNKRINVCICFNA
ncbi:hypothetical protein REC12_17870 [Desulfosporosinus sp. PR]|nr:hypothetical protein [Desulfosporosinus sp. PR]